MNNKLKEHSIYSVQAYEVDVESNDNDIELLPISEISNGDNKIVTSVTTANCLTAYSFFKSLCTEFEGVEYKWVVEIEKQKLCISDDSWNTLRAMKSLRYDDYRAFMVDNNSEVIHSSDNSVVSFLIKELLSVQAESFNMNVVCKRAGVNYSTFRGFKYNNKPLSAEKTIRLLRCMHELGNESWNQVLDEDYGFFLLKADLEKGTK